MVRQLLYLFVAAYRLAAYRLAAYRLAAYRLAAYRLAAYRLAAYRLATTIDHLVVQIAVLAVQIATAT